MDFYECNGLRFEDLKSEDIGQIGGIMGVKAALYLFGWMNWSGFTSSEL
jgi:hypothetical protein